MNELRLPSITMIAGSTHPVDFRITDYNCMDVSAGEVTGYLSVSPYINTLDEPLFTVTASGLDESGCLRFTIASASTVSLSGKFIYQLHLTNGVEADIYEGYLTILANRNKGAIQGGE